jgi:glutamate 5-kinase
MGFVSLRTILLNIILLRAEMLSDRNTTKTSMELAYKRIVVKVGTNVITGADRLLDHATMRHLVRQIAALRAEGVEIILITSGAVGAGRALVQLSEKVDAVAARQIWAAVGQIPLFHTYGELFAAHEVVCAQVLATREDFRDRAHYLNMRNCFTSLLQTGIIPIVNENDVVSVTELMFTDNDELAGLIASMMNADALLLLTNVDGIFDAPPSNPSAKLIPIIDAPVNLSAAMSAEKSSFGRGGMMTKFTMAQKCAQMGITVHIANGKAHDTIAQIAHGERLGTKFIPHKQTSASSVKRWIAHTRGYEKGVVYVNAGAAEKLLSPERASSLLPVGITHIKGTFEKGDIVKICTEDGETIAHGVAQYGSESAENLIGQKNQKPLVHYDYLFLVQG